MAAPTAPEIRLDPEDRRPAAPRRGRIAPVLGGILVGLALLAGWFWWSRPEAPVVATVPAAPSAPPAAPVPAAEPAIQHPVRAPEEPMLGAQELPAALAHLLGPKSSEFLEPDDFPRRFVATLDNLGRAHAPPSAWPLHATGGQFTVETRPDGTRVIATANARRYDRFVDLVAAVDADAAVRLYTRMYPVLEAAWRQLGMGDRYLNDRVVAVIDLLLAAPEPEQPPQVVLTEVKGPVPSTRPWVRYEYADPRLEQLAAGQKILVRVGPANERRLKAKLRELRALLAAPR